MTNLGICSEKTAIEITKQAFTASSWQESDAQITPGEQTVNVISAASGGIAEQILRAIAHPEINPGNKRHFGNWNDGTCHGFVHVYSNREKRPLTLKIGSTEGLFLDDGGETFDFTQFKIRFSLRDVIDETTVLLPIGKGSARSEERTKSIRSENSRLPLDVVANAIVGTWIIHGRNWKDRSGNHFFWPYGHDKRKEKLLLKGCKTVTSRIMSPIWYWY